MLGTILLKDPLVTCAAQEASALEINTGVPSFFYLSLILLAFLLGSLAALKNRMDSWALLGTTLLKDPLVTCAAQEASALDINTGVPSFFYLSLILLAFLLGSLGALGIRLDSYRHC